MTLRTLSALALSATLLAGAPASAFPWMVRHHYASCAVCHVDPSGAGQLTQYGRAQSDVLLRFRLHRPTAEEAMDPSPTMRFLWFMDLPDWLNLSGNVRGGALVNPSSTTPVAPLVMATDLYATVSNERFVGHATVGVGLKRAEQAAILPRCDPTAQPTGQCGPELVAREYWAGVKFADESVLLRGGRLNLPFGLRNNEHTSWVRQLTRTDVNVNQQTGLSALYNADTMRGELMGLLGNFSIGPDLYRERGYVAFGEYSLQPNMYLGLSSLIAHAGADLETTKPTTRHAHGLFYRWSPSALVALLAEVDLLAWQTPNAVDRLGWAAFTQADFEVLQGLHLAATLEGMHRGDGANAPSVGAWATVGWYAVPHLELRVDGIFRRVATATDGTFNFLLLAQLHVFL